MRRFAALGLAAALLAPACGRDRGDDGVRISRADRRIDERLTPDSTTPSREGLAAAIVLDVSGSMDDDVRGEDGRREPKIDVARRAARDLIEQFARYAAEHPGETVLLGIYEFSERSGQPDMRPIMPMAPPDRTRAESALAGVRPDGGTPIGSAMITAKRELDATGLTRRHLLVVTDGENTDGPEPDRVAAAIARRPEAERPSLYFVAFDIDEKRFAGVRDAGGLLLAAANAKELNDTLDTLLRGRILIEK
jgi:Mg-chelatase subunit ChlD